jgi:hypothetical protein
MSVEQTMCQFTNDLLLISEDLRLVAHFGGSQSEAESAIQQHYISINDTTLGSDLKSSSLLSASPFPMPKCHHLRISSDDKTISSSSAESAASWCYRG